MIVLAARRKKTLDEFQQAAATHIKPKEYCFKLKGAKKYSGWALSVSGVLSGWAESYT